MADWLFDIDGTLADNEHRIHLVREKPKQWSKFHSLMHKDTRIEPVCLVLEALLAKRFDNPNDDHRIIYLTAREERERNATLAWFDREFGFIPSPMYMRPNGDYRNDNIVKEELLQKVRADGYNPIAVFEDRKRNQEMFMRNGVFVFDIAQGKGDF